MYIKMTRIIFHTISFSDLPKTSVESPINSFSLRSLFLCPTKFAWDALKNPGFASLIPHNLQPVKVTNSKSNVNKRSQYLSEWSESLKS